MDTERFFLSNFGPSYADLPIEIIEQVLAFLGPHDVLSAGATCTRWRHASQHHRFTDRLLFNFTKTHMYHGGVPFDEFLQYDHKLANIRLNNIDFGETSDFWEAFGESVKTLTIDFCDMREKVLNFILRSTTNLESLAIINCRELFMSGRPFDMTQDQNEICKALQNVSSLNLSHNRYLTDSLYMKFIEMMPLIRCLDLSGCHISFHRGLYKKFYSENHPNASESVLTFQYVFGTIEKLASQIKCLNFSQTLIDGEALIRLAAIENLCLDTLILRQCDQLTNAGITAIILTQTNLQVLDLSMSVRLTDQCLIDICQNAPELKSLKLRKCRAITDQGIINVANIRKLEILDISECDSITGEGLLNGISKVRNETMRELYLSSLNICEASICQTAKSLPNLRVLDLSFCVNGVTEVALEAILEHLIWLRSLNLEFCDQISDAPMIGMTGNASKEENQPKPKVFNSPNEVASNPHKISLSSKAEQEIINDARRKHFVQQLYELQYSVDDCNAFPLKRLKGLESLSLTACNKISDVSLRYGLHLKELRKLSLSRCQQVTISGIENLVKNCPALEFLNLSECYSINDKCIEIIATHLKRLTHLQLDRCIQLTDHSLDYIVVNCKVLKHIDVRGCRGMCSEPNLRLASLSSLKEILMSKPGPYLTPSPIKVKKPKAPPMPSFWQRLGGV